MHLMVPDSSFHLNLHTNHVIRVDFVQEVETQHDSKNIEKQNSKKDDYAQGNEQGNHSMGIRQVLDERILAL